MLSHINFVDLPVTDQDRALAFYTGRFGLQVHTDVPYSGNERWIMLKIPGAQTLIHFTRRRDEASGEIPALPFVSDDIEADYERLTGSDVTCLAAPQAAPWDPATMYFMCRDSENNLLLVQTLGRHVSTRDPASEQPGRQE